MSNDFERRLRAARESLPAPDPAFSSVTEEKVLAGLPRPAHSRQAWLRPRMVAAGAVVMVAVGTLGFGIGHWVGPSTSKAATPKAEFAPGFVPAEGWNALSTGITKPPQAPTAIAANVPFAAEAGGVGNLPANTVNHLPANGIVFSVVLYPRGERSALDAEFPPRTLPLQLVDGKLEHGFEGISPQVGDYRLEAAVGSWNLDVQVFFGSSQPDPKLLDLAQKELDRLVVPGT